MFEAFGVKQVAAGGVVAGLVGKHAVEHKDFLTIGMGMGRKPAVWIITHNRCHAPGFSGTAPVKALAPDAGAGACLPFHCGCVGVSRLGEIAVEAFGHVRSSRISSII